MNREQEQIATLEKRLADKEAECYRLRIELATLEGVRQRAIADVDAIIKDMEQQQKREAMGQC